MSSVTVGGPGLVAVGQEGVNSQGYTGAGSAMVWTSVDGMSWSRVPHDEAVFGGEGAQFMHSVSAGGPGLVAVGFVPLHGMWQGRSSPMSTRTRSFFALPRKSSRHSAIRPTVRLGS